MIQKKVITLSRDDGHLVKSEEGCQSAVSEEKYYKPILEKYSYNKIIEESEEEFE